MPLYAIVIIIDGGVTRRTRTNSFGYLQFNGIGVGQTYIFDVSVKRYQFQSQVISINNDVTGLIFTPIYNGSPLEIVR